MRKKLAIYATLLGAVVLFDWLKFAYVGGPNIINWNSVVHPAWVGFAFLALLISAAFWRSWIFYGALLLYFAVFSASLLNQYLHFSETLTYNCMLWNLVFVTMFYLLLSKK